MSSTPARSRPRSLTASPTLLGAAGLRAGAIDLDHRQRSFSHFFANRAAWNERQGREYPLPRLVTIAPSERETRALAEGEEARRLDAAIGEMAGEVDAIVVDCPGADTALGRAAHANATVIVTPLNDSFVDFDLLAGVDPETFEAKAPSIYAEFVWESRKRQMIEKRKTIDWLVVRNRMSSTETRNQRRVSEALSKLSQHIGFRLAPGLSALISRSRTGSQPPWVSEHHSAESCCQRRSGVEPIGPVVGTAPQATQPPRSRKALSAPECSTAPQSRGRDRTCGPACSTTRQSAMPQQCNPVMACGSMVARVLETRSMVRFGSSGKPGCMAAVSPGSSAELLAAAADQDLPFMPGIATPTELMNVISRGFHVVKFFPAAPFGGAATLQAMAAPFPRVCFYPTGGTSERDFADWIALRNVIAVGGAWLAPSDEIRRKDWDHIGKRARYMVSQFSGKRPA